MLFRVENTMGMIVDCKGQILSVHVTCWLVKEDGVPKHIVAIMVPLEVVPKIKDRIEVL